MKRIFLFILPILIVGALVFIGSGIMQVRFSEEKLMDDLKRKANAVAEALEFSARHVLLTNDLKSANRLVESFQKRERLQGCIIYNKSGEVLAITERFAYLKTKDKAYLIGMLDTKQSNGMLEKTNEYSMYTYTLPVLDDDSNIIGFVEIIYDTSYMLTIINEIWKRISITLMVFILLITLTTFLFQWRLFVLPINQLTDWFKRFQKGEIDKLQSFEKKDELGKLVSEVEQVALSLRVARRTVTDEAQVRIENNEIWTEMRLKDLVHAKLGDNAFLIVSNREPFMHIVDEPTGMFKCIRPASGVVTALDPTLRACGGTWIAHGSGSADKKFVNSKDKLGVPPEDNRYILKRVWLTKEEEEGYYYGFSNEGLWPLCHVTHTRPIFKETDWQMYKKVNLKFAESILEELPAKSPFIFIQDYHFTLLPKLIKERRPDATIALFWHIPWANPEVFAICPYQQEILDGMLGADLIGFHVQFHCNNFLETANRLIECRVDTEKFSIIRHNKETLIRSFPISVDSNVNIDKTDMQNIEKIRKDLNLEDKIVAISVDRIDYTKGLKEKILAVDRFLEKYPQYKNKFVLIQIGAPSRTHIKSYHDLISELDDLIEKKNWKYSDGNWKPIIYLKKHFSPEEIKPYYALGDICIVSSLHDGMNLVAKEFVSYKTDLNGTLILSKFTGAARELTDAVQINPYSIEEFSEAIKFSIEMSKEEKRKRMQSMRKIISENNIYRWAGNIITELTSIKKM